VSYEVLARKWRPQTFDEVVGQDHITRTLKKAVELGRLSHAYLLSGPRGCGKTSTARILAKVINCSDLHGGNPCDTCESCVGVIQGRNLDVMEIDGASHTGVNEVRDLQESIGYVPSQFKNKVYIIDEVHMLSTHAFNALLKTLEEPPARVYFIFATTAPHKIPDTIKSRCQRHQFKRIEVRDIAGHLEKICIEEKVKFEKDALRLLARKAEGSMRDGQSLLDQCITAASGDVKTQAVRDILGLLDQEMIQRLVGAIAGGHPDAVLKELDSAVREGVDLEELLNALIEGFRDLMLLSVPGDLSDLIFRSADEIASMRGLLGGLELGDLVTIVERLCSLSPRLKMASDPRILLESVLVDLALLDRQVGIREVIRKLESSGPGAKQTGPAGSGPAGSRSAESGSAGARSGGTGDRSSRVLPGAGSDPTTPSHRRVPTDDVDEAAGAENSSAQVTATVEPFPAIEGRTDARSDTGTPLELARSTEASREDEGNAHAVELASVDAADQRRVWESFVTHVRQKKVTLGVCLISGTLESIEGDLVRLRFAKGCSFQKEQVDETANKKFLRSMTKKYFGRDLEVVCVSAEEGREMRKRPKAPAAGEPLKHEGAIDDNPLLRKIIDDFDGEIIRYHPK
jgi:DNA polymerase-3 subunit gamma/tau